MFLTALCAAILLAPRTIHVTAFYLPGAAPHNYVSGERVDVLVNALTPTLGTKDNSKLKSLINYDYYNEGFHFCRPKTELQSIPEYLGSILFGDRIFNSTYDIHMLEDDSTCRELCTVTVPPEGAKFINDRIKEDYALNWLIDGLPAAERKIDAKSEEVFYDIGFNLGNDEEEEFVEVPALNNHYDIILSYHSPYPGQYRVVGVVVEPASYDSYSSTSPGCNATSAPKVLSETSNNTLTYSYRVFWEESTTPWATRWDNYLHIFDPRIHWFNIINSIVIVVILCSMVAMILWRTVSRDISRYNAIDLSEDVQEDYGWKLVHGEVFRPPKFRMVVAILAGNGSQLGAMIGVTLVFALLGFLSPSNRGSLATVMMICWTFFGSVSGYVSSRVYASLGGEDRKRNALFTALVLPIFVFGVIFLLDLSLVIAGSSGAVPFGTMLVIVLLWFGISAPLSSVGAYYGNKHGAVRNPVRVNPIPRQIPPTPKYLQPIYAAILGGMLPFGAAFVELYFVMSSLFASRAYYAFGFMALTTSVYALTTATVTILFTYFNLCAEEYRWHWRAFLTGGGSAFWLLLYGLYYWASRLSLDSLTSVLLYLGYLMLLVVFDFLVSGTIGFLASYWAIHKLYSAIRID